MQTVPRLPRTRPTPCSGGLRSARNAPVLSRPLQLPGRLSPNDGPASARSEAGPTSSRWDILPLSARSEALPSSYAVKQPAPWSARGSAGTASVPNIAFGRVVEASLQPRSGGDPLKRAIQSRHLASHSTSCSGTSCSGIHALQGSRSLGHSASMPTGCGIGFSGRLSSPRRLCVSPLTTPRSNSPTPKHATWHTGRTVQDFRRLGEKYAFTAFDLELAWRFTELMRVSHLVDETYMRLILVSLSLLHRCGYTADAMLMTLAFAVIYGRGRPCLLNPLDEGDTTIAGIRTCLLIFLAHTYLEDEPCFLMTWHERVFKATCGLKALNRELMELFRARGYILAVGSSETEHIYNTLLKVVLRRDRHVMGVDGKPLRPIAIRARSAFDRPPRSPSS
eukprot:NODE_9011_length_1453_cov_5.121418.p1 GENE.NODE_9011_length_1453_cov_5.121418~~NODE_9011_length_1453_cov_5.121418.p1  ORF type:complete len:393 (-),score=42.11 NODE_9011_length_1453_cov_5.121418:142-1320(-)